MTSRILHLIFIGNPTAGKGKTLKYWPLIESTLKLKGWKIDIFWTESKGHARIITTNALKLQPDFIISFGGDGTAHEVINGIHDHSSLGVNKTLFTVFPVGTGNDWARYWKIPTQLDAWIGMIEGSKTYDHDLGKIEFTNDHGIVQTQVFNNVAGAAYDAYVADFIESKKKKMKMGGMQYLWFIFRCLFSYTLQPTKLTWPEGREEDFFYTINIGICPYSGGGLHLVPHANPQQGKLAVTAVRPLAKWQVLLLSPLFYTGTIIKHPKVLHFTTEELLLEPGDPLNYVKIEAEGEHLGNLPARLSVIKKALKICAP